MRAVWAACRSARPSLCDVLFLRPICSLSAQAKHFCRPATVCTSPAETRYFPLRAFQRDVRLAFFRFFVFISTVNCYFHFFNLALSFHLHCASLLIKFRCLCCTQSALSCENELSPGPNSKIFASSSVWNYWTVLIMDFWIVLRASLFKDPPVNYTPHDFISETKCCHLFC
jgi:hypothetical protein